MTARVISGVIGLFMLNSALGWILDPASAAAGLAMDIGRRTWRYDYGHEHTNRRFYCFLFYRRLDGLYRCVQK